MNTIHRTDSSNVLLLCRPGFEQPLIEETAFCGIPFSLDRKGCGYIYGRCLLPSTPFIFERQRLVNAGHCPLSRCKPLHEETVRQIAQDLFADPMPWALHLFTEEDSAGKINCNGEGFARDLTKKMAKNVPALKRLERKAENLIAQKRGKILQLVFTQQGLFHSCTSPQMMSADTPGGVRRMRFDNEAPSRSYLKIEEALYLLGKEPAAGQRAIDLGAAPGGWSFAFAKRSCFVLSIDNGPLKLMPKYMDYIEHLLCDGCTYTPAPKQLPVDWMVADMLIAPHQALALLKRWTENFWAENIIVNIKLPQQNPFAGLLPVVQWRNEIATYTFSIRQLFHDRREVTIFGFRNR